jgi:hypothetical protein
VVFDSTAAPGDAAAVYMEGRGEELEGRELERAIGIYSRRSEATDLTAWSAADVTAPVQHRLYHGLGALPAGEQRPADRSDPVIGRQHTVAPTSGGIDADVMLPIQVLMDRRVAEGHGAESLASVIEVLRRPISET